MALTLGNDLTGTVSREVNAANRLAAGLGKSLSTGNDAFVDPVDGFLGGSLRDGEIILGAVAKNTAYTINMLSITEEYISSVIDSLQGALKIMGSSGTLSQDKIEVLQINLNAKKDQISLLIETADFDGKALLSGGASEVDVQVGLSISSQITVRVSDISIEKLFRTGASAALNSWVAGDMSRTGAYTNIEEFAGAIAANENFSQQSGITNAQLTNGIIATRTDNSSFERIEGTGATLSAVLNAEQVIALTRTVNASVAADVAITTDLNTAAIATAVTSAVITGLQSGDTTAEIQLAANAAANAATDTTANAAAIGTAAGALVGNVLGGATLNATLRAHTYIIADLNTNAIADAVSVAITAGGGATEVNLAANGAAAGNAADIGNLAEAIFLSYNPDRTTIATEVFNSELATILVKNVYDAVARDMAVTGDDNTVAIATAASSVVARGIQAGQDVATIKADANSAANAAANATPAAIGTAIGDLVGDLLGEATLNATIQAHSYIVDDANTFAIATAVDTAIAAGGGATEVNAAANAAADANKAAIGDLAEALYWSHKSNTKGFSIGTASGTLIEEAMSNSVAKSELLAHFADNQTTDLSTKEGRALSQDVLTSALNNLRAVYASVASQKENVIEAAEALRATINVTQKAADSYLKTDYVLTAQKYSETIRTMVASITALQAANKIPEAAQRLVDALAR